VPMALLGPLDLEQHGGHTPTVTGQHRAVLRPRLAAMVAHPGQAKQQREARCR
jgi:hypothetical protein